MTDWDCKKDHFTFYNTPHFPSFRAQPLSLYAIPPIPNHVLFPPLQPKTLEVPVTEGGMTYFPLSVTTEQMGEVGVHMADVRDEG